MDGVATVLAHTTDESAVWAYQCLHTRSSGAVQFVAVEDLAGQGTTWAHRIDDEGSAVDILTRRGVGVTTGRWPAVLNRFVWPPAVRLSASGSPDARYAQSELMAFTAGWLRSLAAVVVNEPTPQGLSGRWRPTAAWRALGARAGLRIVPFRASSAEAAATMAHAAAAAEPPGTTLLSVAGELIHDGVPPAVRRGVRRLTELSGTTILGLQFLGHDPAGSGWRLLDATPHPDLSLGGEAGLRALERVLTR